MTDQRDAAEDMAQFLRSLIIVDDATKMYKFVSANFPPGPVKIYNCLCQRPQVSASSDETVKFGKVLCKRQCFQFKDIELVTYLGTCDMCGQQYVYLVPEDYAVIGKMIWSWKERIRP